LPRRATHSGTVVASVISSSPASRSRQISSPAKKTVRSGMISQRLSAADTGAVSSPRTSAVLGINGTAMANI
jgi:hypothetical protein